MSQHSFAGIWQLAKRSFREESSRLSQHVTRLLLGCVLLAVIVNGHLDVASTARGLPIFKSQVLLTHLFLIVSAMFGYSQIIVEERESGTIDLLKLAGIDRASILIGKTLPRLWESVLLIAIQFPFTLLTITLGGVNWHQVTAAYLLLSACAFLMAGIGVFASTVCRTGRAAVGLATVITFVYLFPFIAPHVSWGMTTFAWAETVNLQMQTLAVLQTSFQGATTFPSVWIALGLGMIAFIASWICFELSLNLISLDLTRRHRNHAKSSRRGRPWRQPCLWKDYYFLSGGVRRMVIRSAVHFGLLLWMFYAQSSVSRGFAWAALLGCPVSLIDGTWTASRLFAEEIQNRTWSVLVQTPHSIRRIALHKTLGWTIGMLPSIVMPLLFIVLAILTFEHLDYSDSLELMIGTLVITIAVFAYLHMMVLFSLDWHWKAIPVTLIATCVLAYLYMWMLVPWRSTGEVRCIFFVITGIILIGLIAGFQYRILKRLKILAGSF